MAGVGRKLELAEFMEFIESVEEVDNEGCVELVSLELASSSGKRSSNTQESRNSLGLANVMLSSSMLVTNSVVFADHSSDVFGREEREAL
jgi:hypothetical protein